jgi:hypothetical protein
VQVSHTPEFLTIFENPRRSAQIPPAAHIYKGWSAPTVLAVKVAGKPRFNFSRRLAVPYILALKGGFDGGTDKLGVDRR